MITNIISGTVASRETEFFKEDGSTHNRAETLGGSEIGQCLRKNYFSKSAHPTDEGYVENWGFFQRGHTVEDWVVDVIKDGLPDNWQYLYTSHDQVTLIDAPVSATPDGILITEDDQIVVEIKSLDPRSNFNSPKEHHVEQAQLQIELFHKLTEYRPTRAILLYVNASDYSHIVEHEVERNEAMLVQAHNRAGQVFNATTPTELMAEGVWTDSCRYCGYTQSCGEAAINALPEAVQSEPFQEELVEELDQLIRDRHIAKEIQDEAKVEQKRIEEKIKIQLRRSKAAKIRANNWTISYGKVNGRRTLDTKAIEQAGIDLDPYYKQSPASDRLTIREKS